MKELSQGEKLHYNLGGGQGSCLL